jgi:hypothetical protein
MFRRGDDKVRDIEIGQEMEVERVKHRRAEPMSTWIGE